MKREKFTTAMGKEGECLEQWLVHLGGKAGRAFIVY